MNKILIVDDEPKMLQNLTELFTDENFEVHTACDGLAAIHAVRKLVPDVVLLDINLPKLDGLESLTEIKALDLHIPIIIFTAHGNSEKAIEAMKRGAYDYIEKPFDIDELIELVQSAVTLHNQTRVEPDPEIANEDILDPAVQTRIIGNSPKMMNIFKMIGRAAATDATVLIRGESGTGKELIADAITRHSNRKDKPYIRLNCAALPENLLETELFGHEKGSFTDAHTRKLGRFEIADSGTIFLDEIGDMSLSLQTKLLRVLQQKTFERVGGHETIKADVRVIAATNKDLELEIKKGNFREDLFYRLNVINIKTIPLREHPEDIPLLVERFLVKYAAAKQMKITEEALEKLLLYSWFGNVRELENVIQSAVALAHSNLISKEHLPAHISATNTGSVKPEPAKQTVLSEDNVEQIPFYDIVENVEKELIQKAYNLTNGNKSKAAEVLGISRRLFLNKLKQFGIK